MKTYLLHGAEELPPLNRSTIMVVAW